MKKILFILILGIMLIGMVRGVSASESYQDAEPPATPIPTSTPAQSNDPTDTEEPPNICLRAYNLIENSKKNQESGYNILRNRPWCRVWIALKYGTWIQVPAE